MKNNVKHKVAITQKDLLAQGYKRSTIDKLIASARVFKEHKVTKEGRVFQYKYEIALLLVIGCELFKVGLPFRYVDMVTAQLGRIKQFMLNMPYSDILVIHNEPEKLSFEQPRIRNVGVDYLIEGMIAERKIMTMPMMIILLSYSKFKELVTNGKLPGHYVVLDIRDIYIKVDSMFV